MPNKLSSSTKSSMITRIITSIVFVAVVVPCSILGGWFFFVLGLFLAMVATHEILQVPGEGKYSWLIRIMTFVYVLLFLLSFFIKPWATGLDPFKLDMSAFTLTPMTFLIPLALTLIYFFAMFLIAIFSEKIKLEDVTFLVCMETFVALGFTGLFFLRYFPNATGTAHETSFFVSSLGKQNVWTSSALVLTIAISTWSSDVGAYFAGVLFGKHPMIPRISPHKTWEGFVGGCVFSYIVYFGLVCLYEFAFNIPLIPGLLQMKTSSLLTGMHVLGGASWVFVVSIGLLLPVVGNIGGYLFSLIKRHYAIKDYGKIFPGHGGVIDRFDSVLANSVSTALLLMLMSYGFNMIG